MRLLSPSEPSIGPDRRFHSSTTCVNRRLIVFCCVAWATMQGCTPTPVGVHIQNATSSPITIYYIPGPAGRAAPIAVAEVGVGQSRVVSEIFREGQSCASGELVAQTSTGEQVARLSPPICKQQQWTIADAVSSGLPLAHLSQTMVEPPRGDIPTRQASPPHFSVAVTLPAVGFDDQVLAALRRLSADEKSDVRDWATFGLGQSESTDPSVISALLARADDLDDDTRAEAILRLARARHASARRLIDREMEREAHGSLIDEALEELDRANATG
jgi:hypothetical protein